MQHNKPAAQRRRAKSQPPATSRRRYSRPSTVTHQSRNVATISPASSPTSSSFSFSKPHATSPLSASPYQSTTYNHLHTAATSSSTNYTKFQQSLKQLTTSTCTSTFTSSCFPFASTATMFRSSKRIAHDATDGVSDDVKQQASQILSESQQRQATMNVLLENAFKPQHINIKDVSGGCGAFYHILVVSELFTGKMTLHRHRAVQSALKDVIPEMHGLTLFTYTPAQYEKMQEEEKSSAKTQV